MKVKTICRTTTSHTRERSSDLFVQRHNPAPELHPFERAREYKRALNAVKLERLFAKPFVAALDGHVEGVYSVDCHPVDLKYVVSASADGEVRVWNIAQGKVHFSVPKAHDGFVRAVSFSPSDGPQMQFVSGSDDKTLKLWSVHKFDSNDHRACLQSVISTEQPVVSISHCRIGDGATVFAAAAGDVLNVYRYGRADPVRALRATGHDTIQTVRFNKAEPDLLAAACSDRSILLYDLRQDISAPINRTVLRMCSNAVSWNPAEPYYFAAANEDHRTYVFDMRHMKAACNVLTGAMGPVMDVDYAPTGLELATGSYDRSVRIYNSQQGTPRDCYVNQRMQRVMAVRYTQDAQYIVSGSDEGVVRVWRAEAAQRPGPTYSAKQALALQYADALKNKFANVPDIKRIRTHRHLPKWMKAEARKEREHEASVRRKAENVAKDSKVPVSRPTIREEPIVTEEQ